MQINILTLFPNFFVSPFQESILKRALESQHIFLNLINIRDFSTDKHQTADDRPFGGGPGMVMKIEPINRALESLGQGLGTKEKREKEGRSKVILTSAKGKIFTQKIAGDFAKKLDTMTIICGHYEGVDERVTDYLVDNEIRIGDYVLTGGETAALVMAESVTRLIPGVLGNEESNQGESHSEPGKLGFAQYTRPAEYKGLKIPEVLLSGDHSKIENWRKGNKKS